ncbi:hypothetical protein [Streptomyces triculaminicus]|uniref:hypothetical protein n=1 Tax=Streptomyces triculaminicus TaxID=2816232 RepID=UPI0037D05952
MRLLLQHARRASSWSWRGTCNEISLLSDLEDDESVSDANVYRARAAVAEALGVDH